MAIVTDRADYASPEIKIGPKTALAAFYILIAVLAMGVAIPAAFMSADTVMFED